MPSRVPRPLRRPPNRHTTGLQRRLEDEVSSTPAAGFVHSFWHTSPDFLKHLNILKPEDKLFFRVFSVYVRLYGRERGRGGRGPCLPRSGWEAGSRVFTPDFLAALPAPSGYAERSRGLARTRVRSGKNVRTRGLVRGCGAGRTRRLFLTGSEHTGATPALPQCQSSEESSGVAVNGKRDAVLAAALLVAHKHRLDRLLSGGFLWRSRANHATAAGRTSCGWVWTAASGRERRTISAAPNALLLLLRSSSVLRSNCRGKAASELRAPLPSARRVLGRAYVVRTHVLGAGG